MNIILNTVFTIFAETERLSNFSHLKQDCRICQIWQIKDFYSSKNKFPPVALHLVITMNILPVNVTVDRY